MKSRLGNSVEDGGIHRQSNVVLRFGQILPQKQIDYFYFSMAEARKRYYILVRDRVGYMLERRILSLGRMKSTPTQLSKGEILEALPETEQPNDSTRIVLAVIDREKIRLECRTEDIARLMNEDANLLLAICSVGLRYQCYIDSKRLDFGRQISPGSQVFVELKGISKKLHGTVWYVGELERLRGTMFGVELTVSRKWNLDLMAKGLATITITRF